jgi:hypothetical protein
LEERFLVVLDRTGGAVSNGNFNQEKETTMSNSPTHFVYATRSYELDGKRRTEWTKLGALFPTPKGTGWSGTLTATPVDGRIVILPAKDKEPTEDTPAE